MVDVKWGDPLELGGGVRGYRCALRGRGLSDGPLEVGGGGGHCLFEGSYQLPNYCPCFSRPSAPEFSLTAPYFWG